MPKFSQEIDYRTEKTAPAGSANGVRRVIVAEGYAFKCSPPCEFESTGWATRKAAKLRAEQHQNEHESADRVRQGLQKDFELMQPLDEFIDTVGKQHVMAEVLATGKSLKDVRPAKGEK